jgi:hypothetical protein
VHLNAETETRDVASSYHDVRRAGARAAATEATKHSDTLPATISDDNIEQFDARPLAAVQCGYCVGVVELADVERPRPATGVANHGVLNTRGAEEACDSNAVPLCVAICGLDVKNGRRSHTPIHCEPPTQHKKRATPTRSEEHRSPGADPQLASSANAKVDPNVDARIIVPRGYS